MTFARKILIQVFPDFGYEANQMMPGMKPFVL